MALAERLGYTLADLFEHTNSEELALWIALYREEAEEQRLRNLAAKAEAARRRR